MDKLAMPDALEMNSEQCSSRSTLKRDRSPHTQISDKLRTRHPSGSVGPGDKFTSERQLAQTHGAARTICQARAYPRSVGRRTTSINSELALHRDSLSSARLCPTRA